MDEVSPEEVGRVWWSPVAFGGLDQIENGKAVLPTVEEDALQLTTASALPESLVSPPVRTLCS